jgi:phenylacetate-CoA ligase
VNPWVARNLLYRPSTWLRGEPVFGLLRRYEQSQWWSAERVAQAQEQALDALLRFAAAHTPWYREVARRAGVAPERVRARDLARFPELRKIDLVESRQALQAPCWPGTTSWKTTGGSTGVAVRLRKNRRATAAEQAASWRSYAWYGIAPGDRQARFWGTPLRARARLRYGAIDWVLNRERFSAFAFRGEDLRRYFERLRARPPHWAYGYVSMLSQFAAFCLDEGLPLSALGVRAVVATSEVLGAVDRERIGRAFGAPVFNEYGCGEVGAIAYECSEGRLHVMAENLFVEAVPDPTPDEPGACRLLVTDLHNRATPLIRYAVGDRVVPAGPCACGRGLPAFERVFGRAYDFVQTSDGARFHGEFFLYALEAARDRGLGIRQAQFVQVAPEQLELRVVPGAGYQSGAARWVAEQIGSRSQGRLRVEVCELDEIPRERSGKIRLVVGLRASPPP